MKLLISLNLIALICLLSCFSQTGNNKTHYRGGVYDAGDLITSTSFILPQSNSYSGKEDYPFTGHVSHKKRLIVLPQKPTYQLGAGSSPLDNPYHTYFGWNIGWLDQYPSSLDKNLPFYMALDTISDSISPNIWLRSNGIFRKSYDPNHNTPLEDSLIIQQIWRITRRDNYNILLSIKELPYIIPSDSISCTDTNSMQHIINHLVPCTVKTLLNDNDYIGKCQADSMEINRFYPNVLYNQFTVNDDAAYIGKFIRDLYNDTISDAQYRF